MIRDFALISIIFSMILMVVLSIEIIAFGNLIAKTPDREELRGEKKRTDNDKLKWYSPERMPKNFVISFWAIQILGCIVTFGAGDNTNIAIIGGCLLFTALLFSATIGALEILMYRMMQINITEFSGSAIKIIEQQDNAPKKSWFPKLMHEYPRKQARLL